ncbi:MFS transporter [Cryptosporangium aurantiacum]|uniref:MFS transporter, DHA2 family, multidrug resistance protein n=1 Tax=Cryptosporangium aurantiacum TaxID=134849 RepID=A0A1M7RI18_9ACTN|nr:MFS transporter [Cryptosporangium aurantiacum]SHN45856.1 MFS transporter, DHA2 family, multidrug resistance protein [Cryptosporangium aurantiacum]
MSSEYTVHTGPARAGRKEWTGLAVLLLPLLFVSMDVSVLYFAVPFLSVELEPTSTQQLWIFDVYGFVLAGLLIPMGALGDRIGRRRLLLIGAAGFGAASVVAAYAPSAELLIAARALLGVAGATLMPSTLALIRNMFHDDRQRGTAIAIWTGVTSAGIALGPVLSGLLLEHFWWGSVFLINLPFMLALLVLAPVLVPEFRHPGVGPFDWLSGLLSLATVLPVIWGVKELAQIGGGAETPFWEPLAAIVAGLILGVVFLRRQLRHPDPIVDVALFRRRAFGGAVALNVIAMFGVVGFALFATQYLQSVLGLSPLRAALWSVAPSILVGAAAPVAAALARRIDRAYVIAGGFVLAAGGFLLVTQVTPDTGLWLVMAAAVTYAVGLVTVMALVTEVALAVAPPERAGSASAILESGTELGGALGMALLGSLGSAIYRREVTDGAPAGLPSGLPGDALEMIRETLGGAQAVAAQLPGDAGEGVLRLARDAFTDGMHAAGVAAAAVMLCGALAAVTALRGLRVETEPGGTSHVDVVGAGSR